MIQNQNYTVIEFDTALINYSEFIPPWKISGEHSTSITNLLWIYTVSLERLRQRILQIPLYITLNFYTVPWKGSD